MGGRNQVERDHSYDMQYIKYYSSVDSRHVRFTLCQQRFLWFNEV
jgi:hypothetical protein